MAGPLIGAGRCEALEPNFNAVRAGAVSSRAVRGLDGLIEINASALARNQEIGASAIFRPRISGEGIPLGIDYAISTFFDLVTQKPVAESTTPGPTRGGAFEIVLAFGCQRHHRLHDKVVLAHCKRAFERQYGISYVIEAPSVDHNRGSEVRRNVKYIYLVQVDGFFL